MIGLQNNINHIFKEFYKLYFNKKHILSKNSNFHWKIFNKLFFSLKNNNNSNIILNKLSEYSLFFPKKYNNINKNIKYNLSLKLKNIYCLVFINGKLNLKLSDKNIGYWKIKIIKQKNINNISNEIKSEIFLHLNESLNSKITNIILPENKKDYNTLYLIHINEGFKDKKKLCVVNYKNIITIKNGSYGNIIEHFINFTEKKVLNNTRNVIIINNNSYLDYIKLSFEDINNFNISNNDIIINNNSIIRYNLFIIGSNINKNYINSKLNGYNSSIFFNSLLIPTKYNINNIYSYIEHNQKNCISKQLHKIIANNYSKSIFNGLIKINKNAINTYGSVINRNLILNNLSKIIIKPQLEINSDQIQCNHSSTTGKINKDQIFYLQSRGINKFNSLNMLIIAFANEVTKIIKDKFIRNIIINYISSFLNKVRL